jgi:predicted Zn-dependent protease
MHLRPFQPKCRLAPALIAQAATVLIAFGAAQAVTVQAAEAPAGAGGGSGTASALALPQLGDGADMAPAAERKLGDRIARELYRDPDYLDDPVIMDYVQGIWQPLLAAARLRGELPPELDEAYAWKVLLGRDRTVNAFALPGAYLGLHLGLVGVVSSRDELASVLAHELSHVTQRHISRLLSRQSAQAPWLLGAMILGALAASKTPQGASAVIVGTQAVATQTQLNFSRDMEREADRVGFGVMAQAGFAPQGFVSMFEKLQAASRLNDAGNFPYLRSHPLTTERMSDMQNRVGLQPAAASPALPDEEQAMVAARARILSNSQVDALRAALQECAPATLERQPYAKQVASLYGGTLAALRLREFAAGSALLQRLQQRLRQGAGHNPAVTLAPPSAPLSAALAEPSARLVRLLGAELALAQGDAAGARQWLGPVASRDRPDTRAELLLKAQAYKDAGPTSGVAQSLQTWVADHPDDAQAWQWLAVVQAAQGRVLAAVRSEAEANVAQLDYPAALERLKAAQALARSQSGTGADLIEAEVVNTRLRQVAQQVHQQTQDQAQER